MFFPWTSYGSNTLLADGWKSGFGYSGAYDSSAWSASELSEDDEEEEDVTEVTIHQVLLFVLPDMELLRRLCNCGSLLQNDTIVNVFGTSIFVPIFRALLSFAC